MKKRRKIRMEIGRVFWGKLEGGGNDKNIMYIYVKIFKE